MSLKVANTVVLTDDLRGRFANTTFTGGAYLVMPEDPSVEYQFQGTISGYTSGGYDGEPGDIETDTIDKFQFTTDGVATDVGDISVSRGGVAGQQSQSHGYISGGGSTPNPSPPPGVLANDVIDKFPFAVDTNASDVGDLTQARRAKPSGHSSVSQGYTAGGYFPGRLNRIDRFPFSADTNAIDVGDLSEVKSQISGNSSKVAGYTGGGSSGGGTYRDSIEKFSFLSDGNSGFSGDLAGIRFNSTGASSENNGYIIGGQDPTPSILSSIEKFPFASDSNSLEVSDLTTARDFPASASSVDFGYTMGGETPSKITDIEKFPFASDNNATSVGNLSQARSHGAGQQR